MTEPTDQPKAELRHRPAAAAAAAAPIEQEDGKDVAEVEEEAVVAPTIVKEQDDQPDDEAEAATTKPSWLSKIQSNNELTPPQGLPERWCERCGFVYNRASQSEQGLLTKNTRRQTQTKQQQQQQWF